eukprot:COSAG02_NODE_199_length_29529_cov_32.558289_1_plen_66_part_00
MPAGGGGPRARARALRVARAIVRTCVPYDIAIVDPPRPALQARDPARLRGRCGGRRVLPLAALFE